MDWRFMVKTINAPQDVVFFTNDRGVAESSAYWLSSLPVFAGYAVELLDRDSRPNVESVNGWWQAGLWSHGIRYSWS
jgi:hypothetical protein